MIRFAVVQGKWKFALEDVLFYPDQARANVCTKAVHKSGEIAAAVQLFSSPRLAEIVTEFTEFLAFFAPGCESGVNGFSSHHAGFHGGVITLDLNPIQSTGITANQQTPGKLHFGE